MNPVVVFFHASCVDGLVSGAIASLVAQEAGLTVEDHVPCRYPPSLVLQKRIRMTRAWMVDFRYVRGVERFWDHHPTSVMAAHRSKFSVTPMMRLDPSRRACAGLVAESLEHAPPAWVAEAVRIAEITDSADYPDAHAASGLQGPAGSEQAVSALSGFPLGPLQAAGAAMAWTPDDAFEARLCGTLVTEGPEGLGADPEVGHRADATRRAERRGLDALSRCASLRDGVASADITLQDGERLNRYAVYLLHPSAAFSCVLVRSGDGHAKLTVMRNPWQERPSPALGRWLREFGGGGHQRVGSAIFSPDRSSLAGVALASIRNRLVAFMEEEPRWIGSSISTTFSAT